MLTHIASQNLVNIGPGNGLVPDAVTCTNVDLSSKGLSGTQVRIISLDILKISIFNTMCWKILNYIIISQVPMC